jgi:hypothetical protein
MKAKVLIFSVLLVSCFLGASLVISRVSEHRLQRQVDVAHRSFARHLIQLQQALPLGTSSKEVINYLNENRLSFDESQQVLYAKLGTVPSLAWYCSTWSTYAAFTFDKDISLDAPNGKLKRISSEERGDNCL